MTLNSTFNRSGGDSGDKRSQLNSTMAMMNMTMSPSFKKTPKYKDLVTNYGKFALLTQTQSKFNMVQYKYGDKSPTQQVYSTSESGDTYNSNNIVVNNTAAILTQDQLQ
jgi:hypothetical protein